MKTISFLLLIFSIVICAESHEGTCANFSSTGLDVKAYNVFAQKLKKAIMAKDSKTVSELTKYPISVKIKGKTTQLKSPQELQKNFDEIFSSSFVSKLEKNTPAQTVCRDQGVGWADGILWIHAENYKLDPNNLRIVTINN